MAGHRTVQEVILDPTNSATSSHTTTGIKRGVSVLDCPRQSIMVVNGAANNVVFTVQGSPNNSDWFTIGYTEDSSDSQTVTGHTVGGGVTDIVFVSPNQYIRWLTVNITTANANGSTFTVFAESE